MRYFSSDVITFTKDNGVSYKIKESREFPSYSTMKLLNVMDGFFVDEIASRNDIYGEDAEYLCFQIVDHNIVKFCNNDFNNVGIRQLKIPNSMSNIGL